MAVFTREINGIIIEEDEEPVSQVVDVEEDVLRGRCKSKKPQNQIKQSKRMEKDTFDFRTKEDFEKAREKREQLRELNQMVANNKKKRYERARLRLEQKKELEKTNKMKSAQFQVIKDVKRIKKWSKKAKEKIMKMPKEMFEEYLKTTKEMK